MNINKLIFKFKHMSHLPLVGNETNSFWCKYLFNNTRLSNFYSNIFNLVFFYIVELIELLALCFSYHCSSWSFICIGSFQRYHGIAKTNISTFAQVCTLASRADEEIRYTCSFYLQIYSLLQELQLGDNISLTFLENIIISNLFFTYEYFHVGSSRAGLLFGFRLKFKLGIV